METAPPFAVGVGRGGEIMAVPQDLHHTGLNKGPGGGLSDQQGMIVGIDSAAKPPDAL